MATTKKAKKTSTKAKSATKKKAAPKKAKTTRKLSTSPKAVAARKNFKAATELAVDAIYEAGQKGTRKPSWGQAISSAWRGASLSGVRRKRTTKKR